MKKLLVAVLLFLLAACRANVGNNSDGGTDGGPVGLTPDQKVAYDKGAPSALAIVAAVEAADVMFQFDPTIDPQQSDTQNAQLVHDHVTQELGGGDAGPSCGSVTINGTSVTADFGPAPGCTLTNGTQISGSMTVSLTKAGSTISLGLTYASIVVNGLAVDGSVTLSTTSGTSFSVSGSISSGGTTYTMTALTLTGAPGSITIDGALAITGDASSTTYTFAGLVWKVGDCYPSAGTLTIQSAVISMTVAFDATTPTTGNVTVTVGKFVTTQKLPVYGACG